MNSTGQLIALTIALFLSLPATAGNETFALPALSASKKVDAEAKVHIDGSLDEAVWENLPVYDRLKIISPDTLNDPAYFTKIKFFYTERGLYVAVLNEQPADTLIARLSSRDRFISRDSVSIVIDPSGEGLYAYWFAINLGGTLSDGTVLPERQFNRQWDGPWRGASAETEYGWSAEYFLPWSMMTMPAGKGEKRTLGFSISRSVSHKGERWAWPALPSTGSRFMSALQIIEIENITPKRQFTFYPYASSTYDVKASEDDYKTGFDIFWRPSSNLQLTATVNPDFGNVESDDVVVNLTSFETFFPEKRPFYLEGQEIFATTPRSRLQRFGSTPTVLVNTRRIGSPPKDLDIDGLELSDLESNQPTELRGAAKITGQKGGWRYGVLAAVEDDTKIEGTIDDVEVDLLADGRTFGVARFLFETTNGDSRTGLGWITTLVDHPSEDAIVHGIDGHYLSHNGKWNLDGQILYSEVDGATGSGGFVDINYTPEQGVKHSLGLDYFDEDLDINDFGFLRRNDAIAARYQVEFSQSDLKYSKSRELSLSLEQEYNTDGQVVESGIAFNQGYDFRNNSSLFAKLDYYPSRWDDTNSDGNGSYRIEPRKETGAFWSSDNSSPLQQAFGYFYSDEDIGGQAHTWEYKINWRPSDNFSTSLNIRYRNRTDWLIHEGGRDFTTFKAGIWQPKLEIDYLLTATQQFRLTAQWVGIKAFERNRWKAPVGDGSLIPDNDPVDDSRDFSISRLVFQFRYRWEIAPLSDLFVVYTRGSDLPSMPSDSFGELLRNSWSNRAVDVLVIKLRYRLGN